MAKAQVEIIGLVLILILVSLGILFAVKYVFLSPEKEIKKEYSQKNIAENMLDVILDTEVKCNNNYISIKNLLINCKEGGIYCGVYTSCEFAEDNINKIFEKTLRKWKNDFYFEAGNIEIGQECIKDKKTGMQSFNLATGMFNIKLEICD